MVDAALIAVCGLDCSECDIRKAPDEPELAARLTDWFKQHVDPQAEASWFRCSWCLGDRADHWSPDCWILRCAVDQRRLRSCSECADFPCADLRKWSEQSPKYAQAFRWLQVQARSAHTHTGRMPILLCEGLDRTQPHLVHPGWRVSLALGADRYRPRADEGHICRGWR